MTVVTESWQPVHENHEVYLSWFKFKDYCDMQVKSVWYEFSKTHDKIDSLIKQVDFKFKRTHDKINSLIKQVNSEFKRTHNKIDSLTEWVNSEFAAVKMTILNLSIKFDNFKLNWLHQKIQVIQIFDFSSDLNSTETFWSSEGFSMKIDVFLNINDDSKLFQLSNCWLYLLSTVFLLIRLCHFYNVDWQFWKISFNSISSQTMKKAVHTYSGLAQHDLVNKLSLNLDQFDLMKHEDFQRKKNTDVLSEQHKQLQHSNDEIQIIKQQKTQSLDLQEFFTSHLNKRSDWLQAVKWSSPQSLIPKLFTSDLLREISTSQSSSSNSTSKNTHLKWKMRDLDFKKLSLWSQTESESNEFTELLWAVHMTWEAFINVWAHWNEIQDIDFSWWLWGTAGPSLLFWVVHLRFMIIACSWLQYDWWCYSLHSEDAAEWYVSQSRDSCNVLRLKWRCMMSCWRTGGHWA